MRTLRNKQQVEYDDAQRALVEREARRFYEAGGVLSMEVWESMDLEEQEIYRLTRRAILVEDQARNAVMVKTGEVPREVVLEMYPRLAHRGMLEEAVGQMAAGMNTREFAERMTG